MKLQEIYAIADRIAPKELSKKICKELDWYDNSGVLIDCGKEITGVVMTLDLTFAAIEKALKAGANLIITHHPAVYSKIKDVRFDDDSLIGAKIVQCIQNGISVVSMHLNLDFAKGGTDDCLMEGILDSSNQTHGAGTRLNENKSAMISFCDGEYGKAYDLGVGTALGALAQGMEKTFQTNRLTVYGDLKKTVRRVASFCGSGADEAAVIWAKKQGADVVVSSDFKHHVLLLIQESGMAAIGLTHYASECYGMKKYYEKIRKQMKIPCVFHTDENLL
ncbi:MAG: Nif3-like dinuclear metal center hexameric protein [Clostridia bacterium]|nr:Nif3-like dinuclear metal center hexameric protein [Clostridia bacterium]